MEVSGQLHAPIALFPVYTWRGRENDPASVGKTLLRAEYDLVFYVVKAVAFS
jgi:hypothetical protein